MDGFVTINLESNICDICSQDTGEQLVNCVVNDRCLRDVDLEFPEAFKLAHKDCAQKWETVMKNSLKPRCPSPNRTWKDKFRDLLNRNTDDSGFFDAWVRVNDSKSDEKCASENQKYLTTRATNKAICQNFAPEENVFLVNESYRIERANDELVGCEERARKLRVRSVDLEEEDYSDLTSDRSVMLQTRWTAETLMGYDKEKLTNILSIYKEKIREVSSELVDVLQERDSLSQQADTLQVTAGQLVQLQQTHKIRTPRHDLDQSIYNITPRL